MSPNLSENPESPQGSRLLRRSAALFANFFLIILAYYQVKAASRSLLIEFGGAEWFPYVWVYSAVVLTILIGAYHRIVSRYSRIRVVLGSLIVFAALLAAFRVLLGDKPGTAVALGFYVFVDIFSVVLVEQFWSLANSISDRDEGRKSYWFIGTGGIVGGIAGGVLASYLVKHTPLETVDLLVTCSLLLLVTLGLNVSMWRAGMYVEIKPRTAGPAPAADWRTLITNRYILLIAAVVCLSQLAQPVVEYQFITAIERANMALDVRTAFIAEFFSIMGLVSVAVNISLTPLIHRYIGIFAGLAVQPVLIAACSFGFFLNTTLLNASIMKASDRGLSYSINRASKELLYIPVDPVQTYQAKAWIDMLGYRVFKVLGSGLILLATQWLPVHLDIGELSFVTFVICGLWLVTIAALSKSYHRLLVPA